MSETVKGDMGITQTASGSVPPNVGLTGVRVDSGSISHPATATNTPTRKDTMLRAINEACGIIEIADARNLANDGPAGGWPPQMTLAEWRTLYVTLDAARIPANPLTNPNDCHECGVCAECARIETERHAAIASWLSE